MLSHLSALQPLVLAICVGILLAGLLGYVCWAWPALSRTWKQLDNFAKSVLTADPADACVTTLNEAAERNPLLAEAWKMTGKRLLLFGKGESQRRLLLGSVNDLWRPDRLLHRHFNLSLFEAIPNIAVGIGLFFTFLFLTLALTGATIA